MLRPRTRKRCWPGLVAAVTLLATAHTAHASGAGLTPDRYSNIGLTFGWSFGGPLGGPTFGFDATAGDALLWASAGARVVVTEAGPIGMPYVEAGGWLFLTVGAGWTWMLGVADRSGGPHLFAGTPSPTGLAPPRAAPLPCREVVGGLFYRPTWVRATRAGERTVVLHELAGSLKCFAERTWGANPAW